jgi:hypothetical protein
MDVARLAAGHLRRNVSDAPERPLADEIAGLSRKGL